VSDSFSESARRVMILTVREAIRARLDARKPRWPATNAELDAPRGAFVTLHKQGMLRGCIGRMKADIPLIEVVRDMAIAAAFEDPRFPPLDIREFDSIDIEISVLSPFEPCKPEEVIPGEHGVYIIKGYRSGVFLPQVAPEQGWDRQQLLENLCRKAGLEQGAYLSAESKLFSFAACVFGEHDVSGK
jgi:AmmeMemoRadiSam system protein A